MRRQVTALDEVDLTLHEGDVFGLVGESGSGKSTLAQVIMRLVDVTDGTIRYRGEDITKLSPRDLRRVRARIQMVFQDTHSSLNPRKTVRQALTDPLRMCRVERKHQRDRILDLLDQVGLSARLLDRYPHELSGGQRQRVGIARALTMNPELLIADEPVSSLDVSLQAQILNLLVGLRRQLGLTILFVSHDLAVVNNISTRVGVMYAGRIVEIGRPTEVLHHPAHPYTKALLASVPAGLEGRLRKKIVAAGEPPDPANLPRGCRFVTRCSQAMEKCHTKYPDKSALSETHAAECHLLGA
jgi:oligopeptide/dipeptide ABC transporter ATP-binding protein